MMAPVGGGGESSSETTAALIDVLKEIGRAHV
jgi:hypothetical protein